MSAFNDYFSLVIVVVIVAIIGVVGITEYIIRKAGK